MFSKVFVVLLLNIAFYSSYADDFINDGSQSLPPFEEVVSRFFSRTNTLRYFKEGDNSLTTEQLSQLGFADVDDAVIDQEAQKSLVSTFKPFYEQLSLQENAQEKCDRFVANLVTIMESTKTLEEWLRTGKMNYLDQVKQKILEQLVQIDDKIALKNQETVTIYQEKEIAFEMPQENTAPVKTFQEDEIIAEPNNLMVAISENILPFEEIVAKYFSRINTVKGIIENVPSLTVEELNKIGFARLDDTEYDQDVQKNLIEVFKPAYDELRLQDNAEEKCNNFVENLTQEIYGTAEWLQTGRLSNLDDIKQKVLEKTIEMVSQQQESPIATVAA